MNDILIDEDWAHFFQEEVRPSSPAAVAATTCDSGGGSGDCGGKLSSVGTSQLSSKSCITKHVRKRSRAPRRTPATLLNANTSNFRELVQQFTGRPASPFSSASYRGPFTLNFELGAQQYHHRHPHHHNMISPFQAFPSDYQDRHHHHLQQRDMFVADNTGSGSSSSDGLVSNFSNPNSASSFTMDNILEDLTADCFFTGNNVNNGAYFL